MTPQIIPFTFKKGKVNPRDLKPTGYRKTPTHGLDMRKKHAWFAYDAPGYFEPKVLAQELEIKNLLNDLPLNTPLVLIVNGGLGKPLALVAFSCVDAFYREGSLYFKFKSYYSNQTIISPEESILGIYEPKYWMMDNRDPEAIVSEIKI